MRIFDIWHWLSERIYHKEFKGTKCDYFGWSLQNSIKRGKEPSLRRNNFKSPK